MYTTHMGTMLEEKIIKKTSRGLEAIHSKGMWGQSYFPLMENFMELG